MGPCGFALAQSLNQTPSTGFVLRREGSENQWLGVTAPERWRAFPAKGSLGRPGVRSQTDTNLPGLPSGVKVLGIGQWMRRLGRTQPDDEVASSPSPPKL